VVSLAFFLIVCIVKEPCDGGTSRVQINPFHNKEPIVALYQSSGKYQVKIVSSNGKRYSQQRSTYKCGFCGCEKEMACHVAAKSISCGCQKKKHGMTSTPTFKTWDSMIWRCRSECENPSRYYGGKGVSVCDKWKSSFEAFLEDMGERPDDTTLDRIDNSKGYSKDNCRWATKQQQARNRTSNRILTIDGVSKCVSEWSLEEGAATDSRIRNRLAAGWPDRLAVFAPPGFRFAKHGVELR
jgi:hypothetical protein